VPISVNSGVPHNIVSDAFEGQMLAYIKGFTDEDGNVLESEYFHREDRKGITWSIQVQGTLLFSFPPTVPGLRTLTYGVASNRTLPSPHLGG
jgi:hypothetical protein